MKKIVLLSAIALMSLNLTSCGDDADNRGNDLEISQTITATDLINSTITMSSNSVNYIAGADYSFNLTTTSTGTQVEVVANGVKFDSHMPYAVAFKMDKIKATSASDGIITFSAPSVKYYDLETGAENTRYTIGDVQGFLDTDNKIYSLSYTVNGTWKVLVCNNQVSTTVAGNDYSAPTELYYTYRIDISKMKAEVFIYNVQFQVGGDTSPTLKKISIPDLDVTGTATGFELSGDNIVPIHYTGVALDQPTPYPALTVTNFSASLNLESGDHSIFFNCHDGEHKVQNKLYVGK